MLTVDGMKIDPKNIESITKMMSPQNRQELQLYLGLVNYMKRYSYELTKLDSAFRELNKDYAVYSW